MFSSFHLVLIHSIKCHRLFTFLFFFFCCCLSVTVSIAFQHYVWHYMVAAQLLVLFFIFIFLSLVFIFYFICLFIFVHLKDVCMCNCCWFFFRSFLSLCWFSLSFKARNHKSIEECFCVPFHYVSFLFPYLFYFILRVCLSVYLCVVSFSCIHKMTWHGMAWHDRLTSLDSYSTKDELTPTLIGRNVYQNSKNIYVLER